MPREAIPRVLRSNADLNHQRKQHARSISERETVKRNRDHDKQLKLSKCSIDRS